MGCSQVPNYQFQMGVTVMGFAEDFGLGLLETNLIKIALMYTKCKIYKFQEFTTKFLRVRKHTLCTACLFKSVGHHL